jgi:hypothetical protein
MSLIEEYHKRKKWNKAVLPEWIISMRDSLYISTYSSITVWVKMIGRLGGLPISHLGKSHLKLFMSHNPSWQSHAGGCTSDSSEWSDPPQGPPKTCTNNRQKRRIMKKVRRYIKSWEIFCCFDRENTRFSSGVSLIRNQHSFNLELNLWRLWLIISRNECEDAKPKNDSQSIPEP